MKARVHRITLELDDDRGTLVTVERDHNDRWIACGEFAELSRRKTIFSKRCARIAEKAVAKAVQR